MKHHHIIYNSNQEGLKGTHGFGVRAVSEGTPENLPDAINNAGLFTFERTGPSLSVADFEDDPSSILRIPKTYFFQTVMSDGKKWYVLGRKTALAYDYSYYIDGCPTRPGNYVVDAYAFPEPPENDVFELMLENPGPESRHFIPASPVPDRYDPEMISISVGHRPVLEESVVGFKSASSLQISDKTLDVLFAFITSRKSGKPLLVRVADNETPQLVAGLAAMIPQSCLGEMTFQTNYNKVSKTLGVNIVFLNEWNTQEIFPKQWTILDLNSDRKFKSDESDAFRDLVLENLASGNLKQVRDIVGWCLSEVYEKGKTFSKDTQTRLYNYFCNYDSFDIRQLENDRNLRETLAEWFESHPDDSHRLATSVRELFPQEQDVDMSSVLRWMNFMISIRPISLPEVLKSCSPRITSEVFKSSEQLFYVCRHFRSNMQDLLMFIEPGAFGVYQSYLSEAGTDWENLYPYFLGDVRENPDRLLRRMFDDNVSEEVSDRVLIKEIPDARLRIDSLVSLMSDHKYIRKSALMLLRLLNRREGSAPDFFTLFPDQIEGGYINELFIWQLENDSPRNGESALVLANRLDQFQHNDHAAGWGWTEGAQATFKRLSAALINALKNNECEKERVREASSRLKYSNYPQSLKAPFERIATVLDSEVPVGNNRINEIWGMAIELDDRNYLRKVAPNYLESIEHNEVSGLVKAARSVFARELMTKDELLKFASGRKFKGYYHKAILDELNLKPKRQLEFLLNEAALPEEEAMEFLEKVYPDSYAAILKSRNPNVITKLVQRVVDMFSRKPSK